VIIGLTGGVASGKTAVSDELARLGARVIDADLIVHYLSSNDPTVLFAIRAIAGDGVFMPSGVLDRAALAAAAFADKSLLKQLEQIFHPPVLAAIEANIVAARQANQHLVCVVPLLYEGNYQGLFDQVWVVTVGRETQIERLAARAGLSRERAEAMISAQMLLSDKELLADRVLDNNGSLPELRQAVGILWEELN
jgi:dephospho-CoA kinase